MDYIKLAISVLKKEITTLEYDLKYSHLLPEEDDKWTLDIQKLNRAVNEIQEKFLV